MLLEPVGYHVCKTVISEVSPVNDAKPPILKFLARGHFEGSPVGLALLVNRYRGCLDTFPLSRVV